MSLSLITLLEPKHADPDFAARGGFCVCPCTSCIAQACGNPGIRRYQRHLCPPDLIGPCPCKPQPKESPR